MPAFAYLSRFREGQWRAFRRFMLEERRDASTRFAVIDAERQRIGEVQIVYNTTKVDGEVVAVTEKRIGLCITDENSSLAKLVGAYVSMGGNPFDISMFLAPDSDLGLGQDPTEPSTEGRQRTQPGGGILHSSDIKYTYDQSVNDGDTNLKKYRASRSGGKKTDAKQNEIATIMARGRKWISKEIYWKRTRIEEQIIKLCDLREQLEQEIEEIVWAMGVDISADLDYDPDRFNDSLTAAAIAYFFDSSFRIPSDDPAEIGRVEYDNGADSGQPGAVNLPVLAGYENLVSDDVDEDNTAF